MVKISTKFDHTVAIAMAKHSTRPASWVLRILIALMFIAFAIIGAAESEDLFGQIFYPFAFGAVTIAAWFYIPHMLVASNVKITSTNRLLGEGSICHYTLDDDRFMVQFYRDDEVISYDRLKYFDLFKVDETPEFYFVYIAQTHAYVIPKAAIETSEDSIEFNRILHKVAKYKVYKK